MLATDLNNLIYPNIQWRNWVAGLILSNSFLFYLEYRLLGFDQRSRTTMSTCNKVIGELL